MNAVLRAAWAVDPKLAPAFLVIAAAGLYAAASIDPYVCLLMMPFFALGCARGKHPARLLALSLLPALTMLAASWLKFRLTGVPLVTYDHYFLRRNVLMLAYNDWRVATALIVATGAVLFYAWSLLSGHGAFSKFEKAGLAVLALGSIVCVVGLQVGGPGVMDWDESLGTPSLRTFVKSIQIPTARLRLPAIAAKVPKGAGLGAPAGALPDIFFVLQESTFPPAVLRPGYKPQTLFADSAAKTGPLLVHTFAGGTWKSEFALTTQMRPQEFGSDGLYVFYQLEGHIKRSIFTTLKELGYRTMVFYPVAGNFINAKAFYASIGVDEFYDPEALGISRSWSWQVPDAVFYNAMLKKIGDTGAPVVAFMLTINQHGPHDVETPIDDYVGRFAQSDAAYGGFLESLAKRGRKAGVAAFGDHQPEFTARFLDDQYSRFFTAYDIRCVHFECVPGNDRGNKPLDIVMLAPAALESFGFTLDDFSLLQRRVFQSCDDDIAHCDDSARMNFNSAFAAFFN